MFRIIIRVVFSLLLIISISPYSIAQKRNIDSIDYYISKIDWHSFGVSYTYVPTIYLSNEAQKLILANSNKKVNKLLKALKEERKIVSIHLILSRIFDSKKTGLSYTYNRKGNNLINTTYTYNGLSWFMGLNNTDSCHVDKNQMKQLQEYWKYKLQH